MASCTEEKAPLNTVPKPPTDRTCQIFDTVNGAWHKIKAPLPIRAKYGESIQLYCGIGSLVVEGKLPRPPGFPVKFYSNGSVPNPAPSIGRNNDQIAPKALEGWMDVTELKLTNDIPVINKYDSKFSIFPQTDPFRKEKTGEPVLLPCTAITVHQWEKDMRKIPDFKIPKGLDDSRIKHKRVFAEPPVKLNKNLKKEYFWLIENFNVLPSLACAAIRSRNTRLVDSPMLTLLYDIATDYDKGSERELIKTITEFCRFADWEDVKKMGFSLHMFPMDYFEEVLLCGESIEVKTELLRRIIIDFNHNLTTKPTKYPDPRTTYRKYQEIIDPSIVYRFPEVGGCKHKQGKWPVVPLEQKFSLSTRPGKKPRPNIDDHASYIFSQNKEKPYKCPGIDGVRGGDLNTEQYHRNNRFLRAGVKTLCEDCRLLKVNKPGTPGFRDTWSHSCDEKECENYGKRTYSEAKKSKAEKKREAKARYDPTLIMTSDGPKSCLPCLNRVDVMPSSQYRESFKTRISNKFYTTYTDKIPDYRDNIKVGRREWFSGFHSNTFR